MRKSRIERRTSKSRNTAAQYNEVQTVSMNSVEMSFEKNHTLQSDKGEYTRTESTLIEQFEEKRDESIVRHNMEGKILWPGL